MKNTIKIEKRESKLSRLCVELCNLFGLICIKLENDVGIQDRLIAGNNGKTMWLELKQEEGRVSEKQKYYYEKLRKRGHFVRIVKNDDELKKAFREFLTIQESYKDY